MGFSLILGAITPKTQCWIESNTDAMPAFSSLLACSDAHSTNEMRKARAPQHLIDDAMRDSLSMSEDCPGIVDAVMDERHPDYQKWVAAALFAGRPVGCDFGGAGPVYLLEPSSVRVLATRLETEVTYHGYDDAWLNAIRVFYNRAANMELAILKLFMV